MPSSPDCCTNLWLGIGLLRRCVDSHIMHQKGSSVKHWERVMQGKRIWPDKTSDASFPSGESILSLSKEPERAPFDKLKMPMLAFRIQMRLP